MSLTQPTTPPSRLGQKLKSRAPGNAPAPATGGGERIYKAGEFLFLEGDTGREMFILKRGSVKILKQEGPKMVELATLGKGAVLGEMSLLDSAPRSATAKVVEEVAAAIINEHVLEATLAKVPKWLSSVIKIVVQRLRETTDRKHQDILRNGTVAILRCLIHEALQSAADDQGLRMVALEKIQESALDLFGLSAADSENIANGLAFQGVLDLGPGGDGKRLLKVSNLALLELYLDYLRMRWKGETPVSENADPQLLEMARLVMEAAKANGRKTKEGYQLDGKQLGLYMEKKFGKIGAEWRDLMDTLVEKKVLHSDQKTTKTQHSAYTAQVYLFSERELLRFIDECVWSAIFNLDMASISRG